MDRYKGNYRIPSNRWYAWDYGNNAAYFVTLCIQNHRCDFGEIIGNKVNLTPLGDIANQCWQAIPEHYPFVILADYVIMPNHVHGIIIIDKPIDQQKYVVETQDFASLQKPRNTFGPQSKNLGAIIRGFKIGVTKYARQHNIPFQWQARYHDRVIRDREEFARIQEYIRLNPINWREDEYAEM